MYTDGGNQLGYVADSILYKEALPDKISTYVMSKQFVEDNLKSPRSAKFPWGSDEYKVMHTGDGVFEVRSWVDAQNSFGAMIRSTYYVEMQYVGDNRWRLLNIDIQ